MAREADNRFWNESAGATFDGRRPTTMATNDSRQVDTSAVEATVPMGHMGLCVPFALHPLCALRVETASSNAKNAKDFDAEKRKEGLAGLCVPFALHPLCALCVETTSFNAKIAKGLDAEKRKVEIEWLRILDVERLQEVA